MKTRNERLLKAKFFWGEISNNETNNLFGTNVYKTRELC